MTEIGSAFPNLVRIATGAVSKKEEPKQFFRGGGFSLKPVLTFSFSGSATGGVTGIIFSGISGNKAGSSMARVQNWLWLSPPLAFLLAQRVLCHVLLVWKSL